MPLMGPRMSSIPESSKHLQERVQKSNAKFKVNTLALGTGSKYCCVQTPATLSTQVTFSAARTRSTTLCFCVVTKLKFC